MILTVALQTNTFIFCQECEQIHQSGGVTSCHFPNVSLPNPLEEYDINQSKLKKIFLISYLS